MASTAYGLWQRRLTSSLTRIECTCITPCMKSTRNDATFCRCALELTIIFLDFTTGQIDIMRKVQQSEHANNCTLPFCLLDYWTEKPCACDGRWSFLDVLCELASGIHTSLRYRWRSFQCYRTEKKLNSVRYLNLTGLSLQKVKVLLVLLQQLTFLNLTTTIKKSVHLPFLIMSSLIYYLKWA